MKNIDQIRRERITEERLRKLDYSDIVDEIHDLEDEKENLYDIVSLARDFINCDDQSCGTLFDELSLKIAELDK